MATLSEKLNRSRWLRGIVTLLCAASLSGCVATMLGAAAVTTVDVVHERRSVGAYVDDGAIEVQVMQYMLRNETLREQTHLSATSLNGVVLVTGEALNIQAKNRVLDYIQQLEGVRQVVDESEILAKSDWQSRARDTWLTTKVKTTLYAKTGFDANRVKVVSERGTVYLMGLVTKAKADQAVEIVRHIDGVQRVVKVFEYVS